MKATSFVLILALIMLFTLSACGGGNNLSTNTFPNVDNKEIPDTLETTVGTLGDVYFSSGITDNEEYKSILSVTFKDTTKTDYDTLMEHYELTSTGINDDGALIFDWGKLQVSYNDDSIFINAYILRSFDSNE